MRFAFRPSTFVLIALLLGASTAASAQRGRDARQDEQDRRERSTQRSDDDALSDSVRHYQRDGRGQVLGAERVPFDGRDVNRIKVIDERGRVRVYMDDPSERRGGEQRPRKPTRDDDD